MGGEIKETGRYLSSPDDSVFIAAHAVVLLPKGVAAEVVGQNSIVIYDLVICISNLSHPSSFLH